MSDYVKSTNFASKDSLPAGNPSKIVKGTEIDTEFNNIATAVATKADINSPALIGTPTAPTPSLSASGTTLATVAAVQALYPVGSIYINATSSTNPATLLGFGTWVAFGAGRVLVSHNAGDPSFNTAEGTGGSKDAIVVSHTHTAATIGNQTGITATTPVGSGNGSETRHSQRTLAAGYAATGGIVTISDPGHDHTTNISTTGSSGTNANLPPYIVVYMWKRTA